MAKVKLILAYITLLCFFSTEGILPIFAEEGIAIHSLDELPSFQSEQREVIDNSPGEHAKEIVTDTSEKSIEATGATAQFMVTGLPIYDETMNLDSWFDNMSTLVRMGIVKRRIIKSLGLPGDSSITINIVDGTEIRTKDFEKVNLDKLTVDASTKEKEKKTFHFGLTGKHLIFSKAVEIKAKVSAKDGELVDIQVKHAEDKNFNILGLSTHIETSCNPDGSASIPSSSAIVENGFITFYTCGASTFIIGAGGTGSLSFWLQAGSGMTLVGTNVSSWADISGKGNNATQATSTSQPKYVTGVVNGNPIVQFTSSGQWMQSIKNGDYQTVFAVRDLKSTGYQYLFCTPVSSDFCIRSAALYNGTSIMTYTDGPNLKDWSYSGNLAINGITTNTGKVAYHIVRGTTPSARTNTKYGISTTVLSRGMLGGDGIAEILAYSGTVSATNANRIESYLALKYGITLDQTTATSYTLSDGSTAWSGTVAGIYKNNIAGIGRDTATTLNQKKSQSIDNTGDIIVEFTGATLTNLRTLTWANDGTATGIWITSEIPATNLMGQNIYSRINREWKFQEMAGDIGGVNISYPVSSFPSGGTGNIFMLVDSDGNFSNGGTTFVAGTLSGSNYVFSTNITNAYFITFAQSTGINLWLKADIGTSCISSGCAMTSWTDQSGNERNATQATSANQPIYTPNNLNYNPAVNFTTSTQVMSILNPATMGTGTVLFAVGSPTALHTGYKTLWRSANGGQDHPMIIDTDTSQFGLFDNNNLSAFQYSGLNWENDSGSIMRGVYGDNSVTFAKNGIIGSPITGIDTTTDRLDTLGNYPDGTQQFGAINEVIVFAGGLTAVKIQQIESYLALKYGINLYQTTATNYTLSDGSIAWKGTTAGGFKKNIAGIGRDDTTTLYQKKSQSIDNTGDIIVEFTGATMLNLRALTWANNGAATGTWINTSNPVGYKRINREWQFQETLGDIGSTKISYPASSIPAGSTGSIYLFVDIDGRFSTGSNVITGALVGANYEFGVNMASVSYLTFGYKDLTPPTLSLSGISSGSLLPIGKGKISLTYSDADSGISTGSLSVTLQRYNSSLSSYDSATGGLTESGSRTQTASVWTMIGVGFGKYKLTASISDKAGNITSTEIVFFVDQIDWTIDRDTYNVGDISPGISTFGTGQITITVKTVGAGFTLSSTSGNSLTSIGSNILDYWDGVSGWGYDLWNGSAWTNTITSHSPNATLATSTANINQNGNQNTYTYKIRYGTKINETQLEGQYNGTVNFQIVVSY